MNHQISSPGSTRARSAGLVALVVLLATSGAALAGPTNDWFTNAVALTGATNVVTSFNVGATKETGEPNHARNSGGASVWWSWKAPASGPVTISTAGSDFDTLLGVYTGTNVASLTLVAENDDYGWQRTSQVTFSAISGTAYSIAVDGWQGASGNIVLSVSQPTPVPPTIITQPVGSTNNVGDTVTFNVVASGASRLSYQWFKDGVALTPATREPGYGIHHIQTNDAGAYSVLVSDHLGSVMSSNAVLTVLPPPPPPVNDLFTNRVALTGATNVVTTTNNFATTEPGEPHLAGERGGHSVWWRWTAPASGLVTLSTVGSSFDTLLGVYTGTSITSLTLVAADDDSGGNSTSLVSFVASAGTEYEIAVDGWHGAVGTIVLNINQPAPSPLAPVILTEPQSVKVFLTNNSPVSVTLSVAATNGSSYQWRVNGLPASGATNASLTLANVRPGNSGYYSVIVGNSYGSVLSSNALLQAVSARQIHSPVFGAGGRVVLPFDSQAADLADSPTPQFTVQASSDLANWFTLTNGFCVTNGRVMILDATNNPHRFYRVLEH